VRDAFGVGILQVPRAACPPVCTSIAKGTGTSPSAHARDGDWQWHPPKMSRTHPER